MIGRDFPRRRGGSFFFFIIYIIFGVYFINYAFNFIQIPPAIAAFDKWIIFAGGILVILGGINLLRANRYRYPY